MSNNRYKVVDVKTGEVMPGYEVRKVATLSQMEALAKKNKEKTKLDAWHSHCGTNYTFQLTASIKKLFSEDNDFTGSEKVHIMYVGSHVGYDRRLMNGKQAMTKKTLLGKIKIRREADLYGFYNKLISTELITEDNGQLYWSTELCFKGNIKNNGTKSSAVIRTYDQTIRDLYEQNTAKSLVVVFQLLPYVNKRWNYLCPDVDNQDYSKAFTIEEVTELVRGGTAKNFKSKINKIMIGNDFVFAVYKVGKRTMVSINPRLVWMGGTHAPDSSITGLFEAAKEDYLAKKEEQDKLKVVS